MNDRTPNPVKHCLHHQRRRFFRDCRPARLLHGHDGSAEHRLRLSRVRRQWTVSVVHRRAGEDHHVGALALLHAGDHVVAGVVGDRDLVAARALELRDQVREGALHAGRA